ncbi:ABC-three component system protein [Methylotetracoccus oryzae]|uniref:ABC-three component system protein n=1 Tax=Methylotetracoccus oryzae TaxID=1919059 RepID=UPI00111B4488|nr:ABC-three component system protein [Methylotetracoccus oryzae]
MAVSRKSLSAAQCVALTLQVESVCPLCAEPLFYKKGGKTYNKYEIAHIYPLNPTPLEKDLLKNEGRLSEDVNDERNLIPLCPCCHEKFDKPRTCKEYRQLVELKRYCSQRSEQADLWKRYHLEEQLSDIIMALYSEDAAEVQSLSYLIQEIDEKTNSTISCLTVRKIKNNVTDYYTFVRDRFATLDMSNDNLSQMISFQVKAYYLKQSQLGIEQQAIFENIVKWISIKTKSRTVEAAEILASFFVQNCEIF